VRDKRLRKFSLRVPVTLFVIVLVCALTLTALWNVILVEDYQTIREATADRAEFHWAYIALGSLLFLAVIVLSTILSVRLIRHVRWSQRQSGFVASVSHELNSPLTSIKLFAQTLRQESLTAADRASFVGKILFDVERLKRIIANILRAAEVDNRGAALPVALQTVDLRSYLEDYLEDARAVHGEKLAAALTAEDVFLEIDPMMFRQVLDNIVDNAVRYRGTGRAEISCRLHRRNGHAELDITDRGVGIAPDRLGRIFERFGGSDNPASGNRRGMGIGLFIVRSIVHGHGGTVSAASEGPGRGTRIVIALPIRQEHVEAAS
jgi:signal transduction histidine kinase